MSKGVNSVQTNNRCCKKRNVVDSGFSNLKKKDATKMGNIFNKNYLCNYLKGKIKKNGIGQR